MSIRSVDEIFGLGVRQSIVVLIPEISIAIAIEADVVIFPMNTTKCGQLHILSYTWSA